MNNTFIYVLSVIMLVPLVPAFILYKYLPSKTNVDGPFKGLNLKLSGAFGGYFLLVLIAAGIFFPLLKSEQQKTIEQLEAELRQLKRETSNHQQWSMEGSIVSSSPKETRVFFDERGSEFYETGDFKMKFHCELENGEPDLPKAICIFNKKDGYKVININRSLNPEDISTYGITFNDSIKHIRISNKIDIESKKKDSIKYTVNLLKKANLQQLQVLQRTARE